ncbi:unnamed protein product [marine sediment metagenome]|uniref:Phage terminase small subunit P27 family n=1 Tax=marine sediment metagenome TaxID=412755 RepID=X1HKR0_9ZZZZ
MPGPAPLPAKLKLLKGVKPYRMNKNEPKPKTASSNIPSGWSRWMSRGAITFWKRYAPKLKKLGLLTELDLSSFRILSELYSDFIRLTNLLRKVGETYETTNALKEKLIKKRPEVDMRKDIESRYLSYLQQFGMSPASRTRIEVDLKTAGKNEDLDW